MSLHPDTLAEAFAALRRSAQAQGDAARARRDAAQALLLSLLAALLGRLEALALRHPRPVSHPIPGQHQTASRSLYDPHGVPGLRTARHRGPVPPRAYRLGRFPLWWARNRGARAIPRHAPELRPAKPARAPPHAQPPPSAARKRPRRGATTHARITAPAAPRTPAPPARRSVPGTSAG